MKGHRGKWGTRGKGSVIKKLRHNLREAKKREIFTYSYLILLIGVIKVFYDGYNREFTVEFVNTFLAAHLIFLY